MSPDLPPNPTEPAGVAAANQPGAAEGALAETLDRLTTAGTLWQAEGDRIRCVACGHRCLLSDGRRGICRVRFHRQGELRVPFGYVAAAQCDPVEKKPFYHFYPGSDALTFGMLGCDFHCGYCQNWLTSQALRDSAAQAPMQPVTAQQLVKAGRDLGAKIMVSSYNEPLITAEWAVAVFKEARAAGMACAFVSNGNVTPEALAFLRPWIAAYKIDLKSFDDRRYRSLGGTLAHVMDGIRQVHQLGLWLEVVTLIIPGFNDQPGELREMAAFLASVSRDIPWHVTAFHPDYRMTSTPNTQARQLIQAAEIGAEAGLRFVYAGNAAGQVDRWEHTFCPHCGMKLIERTGYLIREYHLTADGRCVGCAGRLPGHWPEAGASAVLSRAGFAGPFSRRPRRVDL